MKKRLLASLRASMALFFMLFSTSIMSVPAAFASNVSDSNDASFWESPATGTCVKYESGFNGGFYTLPTASAGTAYTLLVVNSSKNDQQYSAPTGGSTYSSNTFNKNNKLQDVSHVIVCSKTVTQTVTPTSVTFYDVCGTANDTYTIPSTAGVTYSVGGTAKLANTYAGTGPVTITATANQGYTLSGTSSWSNTFTDVPCAANITPAGPTFIDLCGMQKDTYTINSTTGVTYKVGGSTVSGINPGTSTVTITAYADQGYILTGNTEWSHTYDTEACPTQVTPTPPTFYETCGTNDDTYTIHATAGVTYKLGNTTVTGTNKGVGTVTITATANQGYTLTGVTDWTNSFSYEACLPADVCPNIYGNQKDIPEGYFKDDYDHCVKDECPNMPGGQAVVAAGYLKDQHEDCVKDECPNINGLQTEVSDGYMKDNHDDCIKDECPNLEGLQKDVPYGLVKDKYEDCVKDECPTEDRDMNPVVSFSALTQINYHKDNDYDHHKRHDCEPPKDVCPNLGGNQKYVPKGFVKDEEDGDCVVDMCPNIEGIQTEVPEGFFQTKKGKCVEDACPNLDGNQKHVPRGLVVDENSNCVKDECPDVEGVQTDEEECTPPVTDVCPNIDGDQAEVPEGMVQDPNDPEADCVTPGRGGGEAAQAETVRAIITPQPLAGGQGAAANELVNTGSSALLNISAGLAILGVTGAVTALSRRSKRGTGSGDMTLPTTSLSA